MLMGTAQVTQNGIYTWVESTKEADNIALYSDVRAIHKITFLLARATTIATRYSIVRTQGHGFYNESTPEVPIFNLKSQHHRLLALTAQSYALLFASKTISKQLITQRSRADHSSLPYTQALLAGLKAYAAETAGDGAEAARRCCGALGCSAQLSAFAEISTELAHYSADAHNHYQQTAIYLMRTVVKIVAEKPIDVEMSYLAEAFRAQHQKLGTTTAPGEANNKNDPPTLLRHRTAHLILTAEAALHKANKEEINRLGRRSAWGALVLPLTAAARAHVELFVLESFVSHTFASSIPGDELRSVLENLCGLFAVNMLEMREGLGVGDALEKALLAEAVGLGDAWGFEDGVLGALGVESGDIYGAVMRKMREKEVKGVEGRMSKF